MRQLTFFDCNASFGRRTQRLPGTPYTLGALLHDMRRLRIRRALVHHALAKEYDPEEGNRALMRAIRGKRALVPCWVVMPHYGGDFARPTELVRQMARQGVRAVRLFPKQHNFSLKPWCSGDLLGALAAARIPTFIDIDQTDWHELHEICSAWPGLPLIVAAVAYGASRQLYALWERHRTLSVATSWLAGHGEIGIICRRFGAERLLFDTRLQATDPGVAITNLTYAEISDEDKALIAHGNIERLLAAARME